MQCPGISGGHLLIAKGKEPYRPVEDRERLILTVNHCVTLDI